MCWSQAAKSSIGISYSAVSAQAAVAIPVG